ncbi:pentalenolactone F synthase [Abditibacteriota bacterium]|nr:pentalenolactone F synthase [Abditibacteriota bacterium]
MNDPINTSGWTTSLIEPFGLLVQATPPGSALDTIETDLLKQWTDDHRLVVLRGFAPLPGDGLPLFCTRLGSLLDWSFGTVNELKVQADAKNYLFTNRAVPFHWDGAFVGRIPHYIFFSCEEAPSQGDGGETLFCDTVRLLHEVPTELYQTWENISVTYSTDKIAHYGGSFTSPLLTRHPTTGVEVLRYAEPVDDLNPVHLDIEGLPEARHSAFVADMHDRLNAPECCSAHVWNSGDFVIADNHALLHGRRAFVHADKRHIRRVNIL